MSRRNTRRLAFVVLAVGLLGLFRLWVDKSPRHDATSQGTPTNVGEQASAANPPRADATVSGRAAASKDSTATTQIEHQVAGDRMGFQVHVPTDVKVGEVFEARIDFETNRGIREIMFLVSYDKSRLALAGWSRGSFAEQGGVPAQLGAEEPSDGNIQFSFRVSDGLSAAGAATLAIFQFEAIKTGTSRITLQNLAVTLATGDNDPNGTVANASVTINP